MIFNAKTGRMIDPTTARRYVLGGKFEYYRGGEAIRPKRGVRVSGSPSPKVASPAKALSPKKLSPKKSVRKSVARSTKKVPRADLMALSKRILAGKSPSPKKAFLKRLSPKRASPKKLSPTRSPAKGRKCIFDTKMVPKSYQVGVIDHLFNNRGLIVVHSTGSGKTFTAVLAMHCYRNMVSGVINRIQGKNKRVIVVTPVSLQGNFKKEVKNAGLDDANVEYYTINKFATEAGKNPNIAKGALLIIDEAHNLRNPAGKMTKAIHAASLKANKVLVLTATPVYNKPYDIMPLVAMVKGAKIMPETRFKKLYEIHRLQNSQNTALAEYLKCTVSYFYGKDSADYPKLRRHFKYIDMTDSYFKEYAKVINRNSPYISVKNPFRFLTGVRQGTNGLKECLKCTEMSKLLADGKKAVVYSTFIEKGTELIRKTLKNDGIKFLEITGKTPKKERDRIVEDYNKDKVQVLVISRAGGEGLDLKGARKLIVMEQAWNPETEHQVEGRLARYLSHAHLPPSQRFVDVYYLILRVPTRLKDKVARSRIPSNTKRYYTNTADQLVKDIRDGKEKMNDGFMEMLKRAAIEKNKC